MLIVAAVVLVAFIILFIENLIRQNWGTLISITLSSALVLAFTLFRRTPYLLRASILIITLLIAGYITFSSAGTYANAKIYLIAASVLASVFLGLVPALFITLVGTGISLFFTVGVLPDWISDVVFFVVINLLASVSAALLVNFLQSSIKTQTELTQDLEYQRLNMKIQVEQSTASLEKRLVQIRTASEISRVISSTLDPQLLLQQVVDLIHDRFELYYVGIFLLDSDKRYAILQAGTGEAGKDMIANNYRLPVSENSMIGWSILFQKPRIAQDVGQETVRFKNPYLPLTRSEMALPFVSRGNSIGSISIQSTMPNSFDENDIVILQGIVDSLAVAFENARLFQQSRKDLEEIQALNREYLQKSWAEVGATYGNIEYEYQNAASVSSPTKNSTSNELGTIDLPITLRDQIIGQITIESDTTNYTPSQLEFIEAIALQTALALDNARLIEKTQRSAIQEQSLNQISAQFAQALSVEEILKTAVKEIGQIPSIGEVSIHLVSEETLPHVNQSSEDLAPKAEVQESSGEETTKRRVRTKRATTEGRG